MLGRMGGSQIARSAGSWALQKLGNYAGGHLTRLMSSPVGAAVRTIGPVAAEFVGKKNFDNAMRRFGNTIQNKIAGSQLGSVAEGMNIGSAYYNGMNKVFDFMKSGGDMSANDAGGGGNQQMNDNVEKNGSGARV